MRYVNYSDPLMRRFHAEGVRAAGRDWNDYRPKLVRSLTMGRTHSSREMFADEVLQGVLFLEGQEPLGAIDDQGGWMA